MYSNELTALAGAFEALAKALRGEELTAAVSIAIGKADGIAIGKAEREGLRQEIERLRRENERLRKNV
ncbi:MAG: hypothetical protein LBF83_11705 [Spirochaetaceae bacterium]|jgi:hypothetical protein|nr:hypothetical protein [Spirochaetaceae bacterium]